MLICLYCLSNQCWSLTVTIVYAWAFHSMTWSFLLVRKSCWRSFSRPNTEFVVFCETLISARPSPGRQASSCQGREEVPWGRRHVFLSWFCSCYSRALDVLISFVSSIWCSFEFMNHYLHKCHNDTWYDMSYWCVQVLLGRSFSSWKLIHNEYTTLNLL